MDKTTLEYLLQTYIAEQRDRLQSLDDTLSQLRDVQQQTQAQIGQLGDSIAALSEDTAGVVAVYKNVLGAVAVGSAVQRLLVWLSKLGVVGAAITALILWVLKHYPPPPP